ncbi:TetR/AcrR family transcriptional regulator [Streptomyces sp. ALI-76-A]|uniref:TetR/AcrR family transcriptional regulator n=1 Tax=Streptomyces sp. ALI-76-A TaxID=3025736 RepID=UPI00256EA828|nr:TetR/AcrR family transcriptional regulator [Streptomyces sp. ALI-76-A]MDL5205181.1 helix-turn-helix domain-containing protein [Streptomyces sp. ALI-76-A]
MGTRRITMTPGARRVLAAASRLFYERGIHAVGVDLIAAEAGVTKKTLYDRFGSKEQIVVEYLADRDERWRTFVTERVERAGPGSVDRVSAVFDASREWMTDSSPKGCAMVNAHAEISDPSHPAHPIITGQKAWMLALFAGLVRDIAPARADDLARTLMLLHEGAMVAHGLGVFPDPIGGARDRAGELLAGVGAEAGAGAGAGASVGIDADTGASTRANASKSADAGAAP